MSTELRGNPHLRRELDAASKLKFVSDYTSKLAELKRDPGHSISVLPDGRARLTRFNCFAYAFGIWSHPEFIGLVDEANDSAIMDSHFAAAMLEDGLLTQVGPEAARAGDIALYLNGSAITHAAVVVSVDEPWVLRSKWGGNEVHEHGLWEVLASYGDEARFFRPFDQDVILARLRAYVGNS